MFRLDYYPLGGYSEPKKRQRQNVCLSLCMFALERKQLGRFQTHLQGKL